MGGGFFGGADIRLSLVVFPPLVFHFSFRVFLNSLFCPTRPPMARAFFALRGRSSVFRVCPFANMVACIFQSVPDMLMQILGSWGVVVCPSGCRRPAMSFVEGGDEMSLFRVVCPAIFVVQAQLNLSYCSMHCIHTSKGAARPPSKRDGSKWLHNPCCFGVPKKGVYPQQTKQQDSG